ncbi:MAG: hypothetical protein WCW16_03020 [Candidatus Magasanikbacteria bacterium]
MDNQLAEYRKKLGETSEKFTDEELSKAITICEALANIFFDKFLEKHNKTVDSKPV